MAAATSNSKLQSLLDQLKQLETEKKRLYLEFEKRKKQREANQRAIEAEKNRTEKRLHRLSRMVAALERAVQRVKRIIQRLKLIQNQQELIANQILLKLEGRSSTPVKLIRSSDLPKITKKPKPNTANRAYPAMPGWRHSISAQVESVSAIETLSPEQAIEAKTVLLSILKDIQSFKEKRQEIENEVDRLKQL
ncbi:MAG: hypothetical protein H3C43_00640 [Leptonema sp. (in: Bacteria)]|nr:hypothetical protein [Leptonema sp. (in: bacteria)]